MASDMHTLMCIHVVGIFVFEDNGLCRVCQLGFKKYIAYMHLYTK